MKCKYIELFIYFFLLLMVPYSPIGSIYDNFCVTFGHAIGRWDEADKDECSFGFYGVNGHGLQIECFHSTIGKEKSIEEFNDMTKISNQ